MTTMQAHTKLLTARHKRYMRPISLFVATLFWMASYNVSAQSILAGDIAPFEVEFNVGNNLINAGSARLSLLQEGDTWTYTLKTEPRGILKLAGKGEILEISTMTFNKTENVLQIQPESYIYRQDNERRRAVDANFDWQTRKVKHTYRGNTAEEIFEGPLVDRLSATLLIMNALRNDFQKAELQVFDTGRIKKVAFINDGTELLKTSLGQIETIRVINRNAAGGTRQTTTWFAPSLDYVPVKIEHRKRNELVARLTLTKLKNRVKDIELD